MPSIDKTRPKNPELMIVDQSDLAKSAAWAWYEHGSGSGIREFDVWRSKMEPRPSRYKLELLRNVQLDCTKNSLLDNYEIERISRQLDHYIEASHHANYHSGDLTAAGKGFLKKKIPKGFWSRSVQLCRSSRNDVVENRGCERRPGVAVVGPPVLDPSGRGRWFYSH